MRLSDTPLTRRPWIIATAVSLAVAGLGACAQRGVDVELSEAGARGQELYQQSGCAGCHGRAGEGGVGPVLAGIADTERPLLDGTTVLADQAYLVRSIMEPNAQLVDGYSLRMPSNDLSRAEVDDIIAFIRELEP